MFYKLYNLFTAPGVAIHEFGHAIFCVLAGVKIHKMVLFRFGNPAGYVEHDEPKYLYESVLVSFGPLIVNSLVVLFCFATFKTINPGWNDALKVWLGFAAGMHAIPSTGDMHSLFSTINSRFWRNPFVLVGYPFVLLLWILNVLKRFHLQFIFTALLFWLGRYYLKV